MGNEQLEMTLCIVKVVALFIIAMSLMNISNALSYGRNTSLGRSFKVFPEPNNPASSTYLGPGYNSETSQGYFNNRYEPPVFWGEGDITAYTNYQQNNTAEDVAARAAAAPTGAFNGMGVALNRGYNTQLGVQTTKGFVSPY